MSLPLCPFRYWFEGLCTLANTLYLYFFVLFHSVALVALRLCLTGGERFFVCAHSSGGLGALGS